MRHLIWVTLLAAACGGEVPPSSEMATLATGPATLATPFGELWYDVVGEGDGTPAILLHGGPGINSHYMNPMRDMGDDRPVVLYDQIGSGRSTTTTGPAEWTVENFVVELETLRAALGLERVHLVGHSWGSILAAEYWRAHPDHVESLVFMGPALSIPAWLDDVDARLETMPDSIQAAVAEHEAAGTYEDPAYQGAVDAFYRRYLARRQPWSEDLGNAMAGANWDIYGTMWGPSEFTATGTLREYDATGWIGDIDVPVLFVVGEYDETLPATVRRIADTVPGSEMEVIAEAAHLMMHDEPAETNRVVGDFLRRVDAR